MITIQHKKDEPLVSDNPWKAYDVPPAGESRTHVFGTAAILVRAGHTGEGEVLELLPRYEHTEGGAPCIRILLNTEARYALSPAYPALPLCIRLAEPFILPPGADISGWIFSLTEIRCIINGAVAATIPLAPPRRTLYGTPENGIVCAYGESRFFAQGKPDFSVLISDPCLTAHPVRLKNVSQGPVSVRELCIYGEQLSILGNGPAMQSERLVFIFSENNVRMSLDAQEKIPPHWSVITKPALPGDERFIVKSFELFKAITKF